MLSAPGEPRDLFISYSRKNKDFVLSLVAALRERGRAPWLDLDDIPPSAEWWQAIRAAIDAAHTVIAVITYESMTSPVCAFEMRYARQQGKRMILVMREKITARKGEIFGALASVTVDGFLREILSSDELIDIAQENWRTVETINWVEMIPPDGEPQPDPAADVRRNITALLYAIDQDLEAARRHARYLVRARDWGGDASKLLVGNDLQEAETWLATDGARSATPEQRAFIAASVVQRADQAAARQAEIAALTAATAERDAAALRATETARRAEVAIRNRVVATGVAAIVIAVALVMALLAIRERDSAIVRENEANGRVAIANATLSPIPPTLTYFSREVRSATATLGFVQEGLAWLAAVEKYNSRAYNDAVTDFRRYFQITRQPEPLAVLYYARALSLNDSADDDQEAVDAFLDYIAYGDAVLARDRRPAFVAFNELALHYIRRNDPDSAQTYFAQAAEGYAAFPNPQDFPAAPDQLARTEARIAFERGQYEMTIRLLRQPIARIQAALTTSPALYLLDELLYYTALSYANLTPPDQDAYCATLIAYLTSPHDATIYEATDRLQNVRDRLADCPNSLFAR